MALIKVRNRTPFVQHLYDANGDSVPVAAGADQPIDERFLFQTPNPAVFRVLGPVEAPIQAPLTTTAADPEVGSSAVASGAEPGQAEG